jgi:hypothetical protein
VFDVLELEGETVIGLPYVERRAPLEGLALGAGPWFIAEAFADGAALLAAACSHGLDPWVPAPSSRRRPVAAEQPPALRGRLATHAETVKSRELDDAVSRLEAP